MMTYHSGLPGRGSWPEDLKYPSAIDFDISMPNTLPDAHLDAQTIHCRTEFANGTLPDGIAICSDSAEGQKVGLGWRNTRNWV